MLFILGVVYPEFHNNSRYAECNVTCAISLILNVIYTECHSYAEWSYILSFTMIQNAFMLSVIQLNAEYAECPGARGMTPVQES